MPEPDWAAIEARVARWLGWAWGNGVYWPSLTESVPHGHLLTWEGVGLMTAEAAERGFITHISVQRDRSAIVRVTNMNKGWRDAGEAEDVWPPHAVLLALDRAILATGPTTS